MSVAELSAALLNWLLAHPEDAHRAVYVKHDGNYGEQWVHVNDIEGVDEDGDFILGGAE